MCLQLGSPLPLRNPILAMLPLYIWLVSSCILPSLGGEWGPVHKLVESQFNVWHTSRAGLPTPGPRSAPGRLQVTHF